MTDQIPFSSFSSLRACLNQLPDAQQSLRDKALARQDSLTKPPGSLGKLEELAVWLSAWQGRERPRLDNVRALVFAGNHGVTSQGVSPYPQSVTAQMVANFETGGAAINQLCKTYGASLDVISLDLETPTGDFTQGPAMSSETCLAALNQGAQSVRDTADLLLLGEMGIGNSTIAAALCYALFGGDARDWAGAGTGLGEEGIARKADVVQRGIERHRSILTDPLEILRHLGGREQAAIAGAILGARLNTIPVLLDGYICSASAAVLHAVKPSALDHCLAAHRSREQGHQRLLRELGKDPILDLAMCLGEGTGAAMAFGILKGAVACHNGMATFETAGVDKRRT